MSAEMAIPGTHACVMRAMHRSLDLNGRTRALDIGAGKGALSAALRNTGAAVSACDLFPEVFDAPGIECRRCDESGDLPFDSGAFDLAVAVEVLEHIDGHERFFGEVARVLKPGGAFVFTTPNILSLKSRIRFLLTGCFYSFGLLDPFQRDPSQQHISPFTLNRYEWMLWQHELSIFEVRTDKNQTTSLLLAPLLAPWIGLGALLKPAERRRLAQAQNSRVALFGRKLVIMARKHSER